MVKKALAYIFIIILGSLLSLGYSLLINNALHLETIIVFFILYIYVVLFFKFLVKLFK